MQNDIPYKRLWLEELPYYYTGRKNSDNGSNLLRWTYENYIKYKEKLFSGKLQSEKDYNNLYASYVTELIFNIQYAIKEESPFKQIYNDFMDYGENIYCLKLYNYYVFNQSLHIFYNNESIAQSLCGQQKEERDVFISENKYNMGQIKFIIYLLNFYGRINVCHKCIGILYKNKIEA